MHSAYDIINWAKAVKYKIARFKSLKVCLKELERFIRNGEHLQTGKPFKQFEGMRSREILANWLLCVVGNFAMQAEHLMFSSDPLGGDGIICNTVTEETWPTEHVSVPRVRGGEDANAETLILQAIRHKQNKGGAAYASGKTLLVLLDAGAGKWFPNKVAKTSPARRPNSRRPGARRYSARRSPARPPTGRSLKN
jgi:hypothetical protein